MPRYVIERVYDEAVHNDMENVGARSKRIGIELFPDIAWEHSHVVSDETGIKSFCVYEAPSQERLREHGDMLGSHVITHIYEIAADITPDDFP
jgi:Nickel responsive protein SCO4226-like